MITRDADAIELGHLLRGVLKNIGNYFNLQGIICCQSITEFQLAIAASVVPPSQVQIVAMEENRQIALSYSNLKQRLVDIIRHNDASVSG